MNREPLVNIPKPKKAPKPLKRRKALKDRVPDLSLGTAGIQAMLAAAQGLGISLEEIRADFARPLKPRARLKPVGKAGARKMAAKALALRTFFHLHLPGHRQVEDSWQAPCQACRYPLLWSHADPAHKERAWKGDDSPANILALHRLCHNWMDADKARERVAIADPASCATGGAVKWPATMWDSLLKEIQKYYRVRDWDGTL